METWESVLRCLRAENTIENKGKVLPQVWTVNRMAIKEYYSGRLRERRRMADTETGGMKMGINEEIRQELSIIIEACHGLSANDQILGMERNRFERAIILARHHLTPVTAKIADAGSTWFYVCDGCFKPIDPNDKWCRECGRPIEWSNITSKSEEVKE